MAAAVATAVEVVGRDAELAAIARFLTEPPPRTLVIEGEPGIGKTTLWQQALTRAETDSQLLVARPTHAEVQISLGGLADLIADVPPEAASALPEIQQRALAIVRAEEGPSSAGIDRHVVAAAFLSLLRVLSTERPVVLAIDDIQWLDESSATAIVFAVRRLRSEDVRLVASCRGVPGTPLPFELERLDGARLLRLAVGPLSEGALHRLLRQRLGLSLSRPLLHAVRETSGGNPFFALELGRAGVEVAEDGSIQLPKSLDSLVQARLARLPLATRHALAYVAALSEPTLAVLTHCDEVAAALEPAFAAGVLVLECGRLRFDHPLLGAAAWKALDPGQRSVVHRRLAEATDDPEERARHLALATRKPDASVAKALEHAATRARTRGATVAAAELLEQARRLTPPDDIERWARLTTAEIDARRETGDWETPMQLVQQALRRLPPGSGRAAVLVAAAAMRAGALDLARQAVDESEDDRTRVHALLAEAEQHEMLGAWDAGQRAADRACIIAERCGARELLGLALTMRGGERLQGGDPGGRDDYIRAAEIERQVGPLSIGPCWTLSTCLASALVWCDDRHDEARPLVEERLRELAERGDEAEWITLAVNFVALEQDAGRWSRARELIAECRGLELSADDRYSWLGLATASQAAFDGDLDGARTQTAQMLRAFEETGDRFGVSQCHAKLTFIELCEGNPRAAVENAELRHAFIGENLEIARLPHIEMNELEALVLLGEEERARALVERLRQIGKERARPRYVATACWASGLLRAAAGDLPAAQAALEAALAAHEQISFPFDRARIRLSCGQVLRRSKQRKAARAALNETLAEFERLGAKYFAQVTRDELARVGGRAPTADGQLTPTEERVARLVAQGLSNKEVAAQLFITVRTVEATLTRVYAKLGVSSRLQLSHLLHARAAETGLPETRRREPLPTRVLATVLFTDIVGSTDRARELGDSRWADLLRQHQTVVRHELARFQGREIDSAGDGVFASFDGPEQAIRCACAIRAAVRRLGLELRSGLHTGECEVVGGKLAGIAIHTGARVAEKARPGEVLVSRTVKDLVAGSELEFEERGRHELKGLSGAWELYALQETAG